MVELGRRRLLLGSAAGFLAAACGSDDRSNATAEPQDQSAPPRFGLAAMFPAAGGFLVPGIPQRMPFRIVNSEGVPLTSPDEPLTLSLTDHDELVADVPLTARGQGQGASFFTAEATFDQEGVYQLSTTVDGVEVSTAVQVDARQDVGVPQVGDTLRDVTTPTVSEQLGFSPYCTASPPCPLHSGSVSEVSGTQPLGLFIGTPAYCQIGVCGPLLDMVVATSLDEPAMSFVHAEVYTNPDEVDSILDATPAPVMTELGLTYEPVLFITSPAGTITARLDTIFDETELAEAVASATPEE